MGRGKKKKEKRNENAKSQKAKAKFPKRYEQSSSSEQADGSSEKAVQDWAKKG